VSVLETHTILGKVFDSKRAGRNNDDYELKGIANFEKAKSFIIIIIIIIIIIVIMINLYLPY
jgi:t-SNARE complex subunit (syntaxin)